MTQDFPANAVWRKSSHSGSGNDTCVEVSMSVSDVVGVRDPVDPDGPRLAFAPSAWCEFTSRVKGGDLAL